VPHLSGGELRAAEISRGEGGAFNFTGGTLHADQVSFDLVNSGGTLAPGHRTRQTYITGDLTLDSGTLAIELESSTVSESLPVSGDVILGGELSVSTLAGFSPTAGDHWPIISAGSIAGEFPLITPGYSVQQHGNQVLLYFGVAAPILAGDFNGDATVDAADYVVWRVAMTGGTVLRNETASLGIVDQADYDAWRANYGAAGSQSSQSEAATVPEPACRFLLLSGWLAYPWVYRVARPLAITASTAMVATVNERGSGTLLPTAALIPALWPRAWRHTT
jgi:hypothetical protein